MRRSKAEIYLHFVWATRGREPLLTPQVEAAVHRCLQSEAHRMGAVTLAVGGTPDHVHLLVQMTTTVSVAQFAKQLKGVSSKMTSDTFVHGDMPRLDFFGWQEGYGVFSVSPAHLPTVRAYVHAQKHHHADNTLRPRYEPDFHEPDPSAGRLAKPASE